MSSQNQKSTRKPRDPDLIGAEAAMRRAEETTGSLAVYKDGKIVQEKIGKGASR